jgi:hypothetical protein
MMLHASFLMLPGLLLVCDAGQQGKAWTAPAGAQCRSNDKRQCVAAHCSAGGVSANMQPHCFMFCASS